LLDNVTLKVHGMSCGHCVKVIEEGVGKFSGINVVSVDLQYAQVTVNYNKDEVCLGSIKETIEKQGYDVQ
jgi:copper chaperone